LAMPRAVVARRGCWEGSGPGRLGALERRRAAAPAAAKSARVGQAGLLRLLLSLGAAGGAASGGPSGPDAAPPAPLAPQLVAMTFANVLDPRMAFLQVSAAAHGLYPGVLGVGLNASWGSGLGKRTNALKRRVQGQDLRDQDVLLFVDAYDVIVFAGRERILAGFLALERRSNRSLFFNGEDVCFPGSTYCEAYPPSPHQQWRYLNAGVILGRVGAFREMLRGDVPDEIPDTDQGWYQRYMLQHPGRVGIDTSCEVVCSCSAGDFGRQGLVLRGGELANDLTGTRPSLLHFLGSAKGSYWSNGVMTSQLQETFRQVHPEAAAFLFDVTELSLNVGSVNTHKLMTLRGSSLLYFRLRRMSMCFRCRVLCTIGCDTAEETSSALCADIAAFAWILRALLVTCAIVALRYALRAWRRRCQLARTVFVEVDKVV